MPQGRFAARIRPVLLVVAALSGFVTRARAGWSEFPTSSQVASFARDVDSVVVWSIELPDSAKAAGTQDSEILEVARVRQRAVMRAKWGRKLAETLLTPEHLDGHCQCHLEKDRSDSSEVVVPVAEFHVNREVMWIAVPFRDSCATVFLQQGTWGTARLDEDRGATLAMFRDALPAEEAFARDWFPPVRRKTEWVYVDEMPEAIDRVKPPYPTAARMEGASGTVLVMALIDTDGTVADARIRWSIPLLDAPAIGAVRLWKFKPARAKGKPVKVWVQVPVRFTLH